MRIQKLLSERGVASRRKSEELVQQGRVTVNGALCLQGQSVDPDKDLILVDGKPLPEPTNRVYIMLHKPRGYVTTLSDEKGRKIVTELVDCGRRVYPVGRLDMDSEGLLLLTDDGAFANEMMHPRHGIEKVYQVTVTGCTQEAIDRVKLPVTLDGYTISPPGVRVLKRGEKSLLEIIIHEGRNRQVRRMCALAGMEVLRLKRVREGALSLGNLPLGKWRYLSESEIASLTNE